MVAQRARSMRLRDERLGHLAGPRLGRRDAGSAGRSPITRSACARAIRRPTAPASCSGRRTPATRRARGWCSRSRAAGRSPSSTGCRVGWNDGLAQAARRGRGGDQHTGRASSRSTRRAGRAAAPDRRLEGMDGRRRGLRRRGDLAGLSADGIARGDPARRARQHDAPRAPDRRAGERGRRRGTRRRHRGGHRRRLVAGSRRPAARRHPRARGPRARRDLGPRDGRLARPRRRRARRPSRRRLVPGRRRRGAVARLDGRDELYRVEVATGAATRIPSPPRGAIGDARVRPDGRVWFVHTGRRAPHAGCSTTTGAEPISVDAPAPPGRPFQDWRYTNDHGQEVHGWIVEPDGDGPHPLMVFVHGGPHWLYDDHYMPEVQAYVDRGSSSRCRTTAARPGTAARGATRSPATPGSPTSTT